jgi:hypothetical protein
MGKSEDAAVGKTPPQICAKTHQCAQQPGPRLLQHPRGDARFARRFYSLQDNVILCYFGEDLALATISSTR